MCNAGMCSAACFAATLIIFPVWFLAEALTPFLEPYFTLPPPLLLLPFLADLKSPQSAGLSQRQLL